MFVAWSPIRSMFFEQKRRCAQLHHVREQIAEDRVLQRVEVGVSLPDVVRALGVAPDICVEHVLQQFERNPGHVPEADDGARDPRLAADLDRALGDVFGEIADPLQIAGDVNGPDQLAQVEAPTFRAYRVAT